MSNKRTIGCMILAILLLGLIAWRGARLLQLRDLEQQLEAAEARLDDADVAPASNLLRELAAQTELTRRQLDRRDEAVIELVERQMDRDPPLRRVGGHDWKDGRDAPYVVTIDSVTISAGIPSGTAPWVRSLRVGEAAEDFTGDPPRADVRVPVPDDAVVTPELALVVALPSGETRELPLPASVPLRRTRSELGVAVRVGDDRDHVIVLENETSRPTLVVVEGPQPVTITLRNPAGLAAVRWTLDGTDANPTFAGSPTTWSHTFPAEHFATKDRRVFDLVIEATSGAGVPHEARARFDVRGPAFNPVRAVRVNDVCLEAETTVTLNGPTAKVTVDVAVPVNGVELSIRANGRDYPLRQTGDSLETEAFTLPTDKPVGVIVKWGARVLPPVYRVRVDTAPPTMTLQASDGTSILPDADPVPAVSGTTYTLEVRDPSGIRDLEVAAEGMDRLSEDRKPTCVRRTYELGPRGNASLNVIVVDRAGQRTEGIFRLRAMESVRVERIEVEGQAVGDEPLLTPESRITLALTCVGEGDVSVNVLAPDGAVRSTVIAADAAGMSRAVEVDLGVAEGLHEPCRIEILDADGQRLARAAFDVDRRPPELRVDPAVSEAGALMARPDQRFSVEVRDASDVGEPEVTGAAVTRREPLEDGVRLHLTGPARLPAEVTIDAKDAAGNEVSLAFTLAPSIPPKIRLTQDGAPVTATGALRIRRLSDLGLSVEGGRLVELYLSDRPLVLQGALLPDVDPVPADPTLVVRAQNDDGAEARVERALEFIPWTPTPGLQSRAEALRKLPAGPDVRARAARLVKDAELEASRHVISGNLGPFLDRIRGQEGKGNGAGGPGALPRNLPAILRNEKDGANLVLIGPAKSGPQFAPYYIYKTEVTIGMFRRFLEDVGQDSGWWAALSDPQRPGRPIRRPEEARRQALWRVGTKTRDNRPVMAVNTTLAGAYMRWAKSGLRNGRLDVPTLLQWQLAAGRARWPNAVYPSTGAFPDGSDLLGFRATGADGGAAFGYTIPESPQATGTYAAGAFGLYDMAGNAWEWVRGPRKRWVVIGGGHASNKDACQLDEPLRRITGPMRSRIGLRLVWNVEP